MPLQEENVKGLVTPDLSKAQDKNEFLLFAVLLNLFRFFPKEIMAYVEYLVLPTTLDKTDSVNKLCPKEVKT